MKRDVLHILAAVVWTFGTIANNHLIAAFGFGACVGIGAVRLAERS